MKQLFITILLLTTVSCKEDKSHIELIEGVLYIKLIDVNNMLYSLSDEEITKFKNGIYDNESNYDSESDKKFVEYHKILIDNNLVKKPHFKLKTEDNRIINVYTNEVEYAKLSKQFNNLDREKEKIIIKFEGIKISDGILDTDNIFNQAIYKIKKITSVNKEEGKTDWDK